MDDLIGTLVDAGMSPQEAREMLGPETGAGDSGARIEPAVRALLITARDDRQPPGPQVVVPSGLTNSLPDSRAAKPVRVDTEDSYRSFRRGGRVDMQALDAPENAENVPDMLNQLAQAEAGLASGTESEFSRGYASQWINGAGRKRLKRTAHGTYVGDIMDMQPASQYALTCDPNAFSPDQECLLCGVPGERTPLCSRCFGRPQLLAPFQRGYASQHIVGLFERGSAASLHDPNPSARYNYASVLGDDFYRLKRTTDEQARVLGDDEFYRMPRMQRDLSDIFEDAQALSKLSADRAEAVPLSFAPDIDPHVAAWKQGDNLYASIRVTGWDRQPRILTAATSYPREVGIVVGYTNSASVPPAQTLAVLDPLARTLGASRLVPRLAAAAPAVLRASRNKLTPLVMTVMPTDADVDNLWV